MQFSTFVSFAVASFAVASASNADNSGMDLSDFTSDDAPEVPEVPASGDMNKLAQQLKPAPEAQQADEDVPAHVSKIIGAVKTLAENTVGEIEKIAQQQDIPLDNLISSPELSVSSINKRSVELEGRSFMLLLPLVMGLAKVVINGVADVSDAAEIPVLGSVLKGAASFL